MNKESIRVLLVEEDLQDARLLRALLAECHATEFRITHVDMLLKAIERLSFEQFDVVLLDLSLPDSDGVDTLICAHRAMAGLPIIVLTGLDDESAGVKAVQAGAQDYLIKGKATGFALARAMRYAIERHGLYESLKQRTIDLGQETVERKRSERALRESEQRFRDLVQNSQGLICAHDLEGRLLSVNPAGAAALGYKPDEIVGAYVKDFISPSFRHFFDYYLNHVCEHRSESGILRVITRWGEERIWHYRNLLCQEEGIAPYVIGYALDITERARAEEERARHTKELENVRREQLEMKDQFFSHVSHELRSPLTAIHQFTTILLDGLAGEINDEQRECLDIVLKNANQLRSMITDLLEVTRAENGKLTIELSCLALPELISETVKTFKGRADEKRISITTSELAALPPVYADACRVRQILSNLIDNAIKFTPSKGEINVSASVAPEEPDLARIRVRDTGCGISPEGLPKIFERLYQDRNAVEFSRKGLGLGLRICQELVSLQGGRIWAESKQGQGSDFFFTLPLAPSRELTATVKEQLN